MLMKNLIYRQFYINFKELFKIVQIFAFAGPHVQHNFKEFFMKNILSFT